MRITEQAIFGTTAAGEPVRSFCLQNEITRAEVLTYGAILRVLEVRGRDGRPVDVALGYDTLADYERGGKYLGAIVGRCANRIARGKFTLDGTPYTLAKNNGHNHLHGGQRGFSDRVWDAQVQEDGLHLTLDSADGEEGYPGNLHVEVVYSLREDGALLLDYHAESDQNTVCNLTNHTYFNLAGAGSGSVLGQQIQLFADLYTPADAEGLPTGVIVPVDGTPMDLREPTPIGAHIDDGFEQLRLAGGYDHNWVVRGRPGELRAAARAVCEETGLVLEVWTTQPGVQFYTANFLADSPAGKGGAAYPDRSGFCIETQAFPNAVNCPSFPQPVLLKGAKYREVTVFALHTL